jgi:hypothetical protein
MKYSKGRSDIRAPFVVQGALRRQARFPSIKGFGPGGRDFGNLVAGFLDVAQFAVILYCGKKGVQTFCPEHPAKPGKVVGLALQFVTVLGRGERGQLPLNPLAQVADPVGKFLRSQKLE